MVVHFIVRPQTKDTVWDLVLFDREGDELFEVSEQTGRHDYKDGLPLGKDAQEKLTICFSGVTKNEPIKVIFKTQEIK